MQVQAYAKKLSSVEGIVSLETKRKEKVQSERSLLLAELGLKQQLAVETIADIPYEELVGANLITMGEFLPTRYRGTIKDGEIVDIAPLPAIGWPFQGITPWSFYAFDLVPTEVLREIKKAKDSKLFHRIEIWTTEEVNLDPMAVGIVTFGNQDHAFPIVRWAECLLSMEEIREKVKEKKDAFASRLALIRAERLQGIEQITQAFGVQQGIFGSLTGL